jgi:hypothetical protein
MVDYFDGLLEREKRSYERREAGHEQTGREARQLAQIFWKEGPQDAFLPDSNTAAAGNRPQAAK